MENYPSPDDDRNSGSGGGGGNFKYWLIVACLGLGFIYIYMFWLGNTGWGYMGYYGYHRGPSFFLMSNVGASYGPSVRSGSVGGPNLQGRGPGRGK